MAGGGGDEGEREEKRGEEGNWRNAPCLREENKGSRKIKKSFILF